jgi:hypothetical protein
MKKPETSAIKDENQEGCDRNSLTGPAPALSFFLGFASHTYASFLVLGVAGAFLGSFLATRVFNVRYD